MGNAAEPSKVADALRFLRTVNGFYEFDAKERVARVAVHFESLGDEVAAHIGCLVDLRDLQIRSPTLTDAGLACLEPLTKLKKLNLASPYITGDSLAFLSGMSRLQELYLETEQLDGRAFTHLATLLNLVELSIDGGRFTDGDMAPLAALSKLQRLSVTHNESISGSFVDNLSRLTSLQHLHPGENLTDAALAAIAKLKHLERLCLDGAFSDVGFQQIKALRRLSVLTICAPMVTSVGVSVVAHFPELHDLRLNAPKVTDEVVQDLAQCASLEILRFHQSVLSETGLQNLRNALPRCEVIDEERDRSSASPVVPLHEPGHPRFDSRTPFVKLLSEADDYDLVDGTYEKIGRRYESAIDVAMPIPETWIRLVWFSQDLIGWGGFERLFEEEISGDPEFETTAQAYKALGLDCEYDLFREAFALFPRGVVPRDAEKRRQMFEEANKSARCELEKRFGRAEHLRLTKMAEFIRAHATELEYLNDAP